MSAIARFAFAAGLCTIIFFSGCKVREPGSLETSLMRSVEHRVSVGNKKTRNPLSSTSDNIAQGKEAFSSYCTVCHGLDGQNTGVPFAQKMFPPVPSLASSDVQSYTDGQLEWIIANGLGPSGMPASRGILSDEEIWSIVLYLRHLPAAGSLGEPPVYSGEACAPSSRAPDAPATSASRP
jgi:cytochrome c